MIKIYEGNHRHQALPVIREGDWVLAITREARVLTAKIQGTKWRYSPNHRLMEKGKEISPEMEALIEFCESRKKRGN